MTRERLPAVVSRRGKGRPRDGKVKCSLSRAMKLPEAATVRETAVQMGLTVSTINRWIDLGMPVERKIVSVYTRRKILRHDFIWWLRMEGRLIEDLKPERKLRKKLRQRRQEPTPRKTRKQKDEIIYDP